MIEPGSAGGSLSVDQLLAALGTCGGEEPGSPAEAVLLVRRHQASFAATLFSAWLRDGERLNPSLRAEVDAARERIDFYRAMAGRVFAAVPGLTSIKGLEVAALYPPGLVRAMNDLDLIALDEADLWAAVRLLVDDGWEIDTATFSRFAGALQVMVSMRRPHEDPWQLPYGIELATYFALGNLGGIAPVATMPEEWRVPAVKSILMLLYERFEQPFRARDLVDASLLAAAMDDADRLALFDAIATLRLHPEYAELARLVADAGLAPLPAPPASRLAGPVSRARRVARGVGFLRRPIAGVARHLQRRVVGGVAGGTGRRLLAASRRVLPAYRAIQAGLLGFGLPLDVEPPATDRAVLRHLGKLTWVDTPVGRFLLTTGDDVTQSAVDRLSVPEPTP